MGKTYNLTINEKQADVIKTALEEYFRIRMNQWMDLSDELSAVGFTYNKEDPENERKFQEYIDRRDASKVLFEQAMLAAQPQRAAGKPIYKTEQMLVAEDIWQVIRHRLYLDRGGDPNSFVVDARKPLRMSEDPLPGMKALKD